MDDPAVTKIPVLDCGEKLVDLGQYSGIVLDLRLADNKGLFRLARQGLAQRLSQANESLPDDLCIMVVEGYRPPNLQVQYFNAYADELKKHYPALGVRQLHSLAARYVAPPFDIPPHCAGAAIDLTLAYLDGTELDMGTQINDSPEDSQGKCYFDSLDISPEARANRTLLAKVLKEVGLVNYPTEWWHWSYGDRYWALSTGASRAIYGLVEVPE